MRQGRVDLGPDSRRRPVLVVAAVVALCLTGLALERGSSQAAFEGRNGKIAFARIVDRGFASVIYTANPDGTGIKPLTDGCCADQNLGWSPDGRRIAFVRDRRIFVMQADGGRLHRVTRGKRSRGHRFSDIAPSWSPNGHRLVFARVFLRATKQRSDLYTVRPNGERLRAVAHTRRLDELYPSWSPVGRWIAFSNRRPTGVPNSRKVGVYLVRPDGDGLTPVALSGLQPFSIDWAPDGGRLVYSRRVGKRQQLLLVDAGGGEPRQVTRTRRNSGMPAFSPSGTRILFSTRGELNKIRLRGGDPRPVFETGSDDDIDPSWQAR